VAHDVSHIYRSGKRAQQLALDEGAGYGSGNCLGGVVTRLCFLPKINSGPASCFDVWPPDESHWVFYNSIKYPADYFPAIITLFRAHSFSANVSPLESLEA